MGKKTSQKMSAQRRKRVVIGRRQGVCARGALAQRLMQVPAARHHVLELWARHERRVITVPAADLFHGATEQHHGIGRRKSDLRLEREFALAGAELDFDGAQRQAKRDDLAAQDFENRLDLIEALAK